MQIIFKSPKDVGRIPGRKSVREFSAAEIIQDLDAVVNVFDDLEIEYMVIGGLALSVWGRPRMTLDIDFLVMTDEAGLKQLEKQARTQKIKIDQKWRKWNPTLRPIQLRLRLGQVSIDVLAPRDEHDREAILRRKKKRLGKRLYYLIAPEDFVLQKLKVGRPRDFEDAVTVLERRRGRLDLPYIKRWARQLGIIGEFNYVAKL